MRPLSFIAPYDYHHSDYFGADDFNQPFEDDGDDGEYYDEYAYGGDAYYPQQQQQQQQQQQYQPQQYQYGYQPQNLPRGPGGPGGQVGRGYRPYGGNRKSPIMTFCR